MDYDYITKQEGYRLEDLKKENQEIINNMTFLLEQFENAELENIACYCDLNCFDDDTILNRMIQEITEEFKKGASLYLYYLIKGVQISLADSELANEPDNETGDSNPC